MNGMKIRRQPISKNMESLFRKLQRYFRNHSEDEDRFILLGKSSILRILVVCHCYRANDDVIRIISARKATRNESSTYKRRK